MSKVRRHLGIVVCLIVLAVAVTPAAPLGAAGPLLMPAGDAPTGVGSAAGTGPATGNSSSSTGAASASIGDAIAAGLQGIGARIGGLLGSGGVSPAETGISYGSDGRLTVLLIGSDWRPKGGGERTDVILVMSIDPTNGRVAAASIPRDVVFFPLHGGGTSGTDRVNTIYYLKYRHNSGHTHKFVDTAALNNFTKDVSLALGVEIDYWAMVRFVGFVKLIDKISGANVDIADPITDTFYPSGNTRGIYFPKATSYHLKGDPVCHPKPYHCHSALAYARSRHGTVGTGYNGDFPRARRQQTLTMAAAASFIAHISAGEYGDFVNYTVDKLWTNIPRNVTALGDLWNLAEGAHLAHHDTIVFGPSKWAHETAQTPLYTYRLYLNLVRGWIDTHLYPI